MGAVPMAYALWDRHLRHNPGDPKRPNRDRFILSPGHASALLYALLHLTGYDLPVEDLKSFWQRSSRTPGHPEYGLTPGVEMTTGPLGQGFAHGVGMAIAELWLAEHYNRPGHEIINHYTYAIVSDGGLQEGVASEAASLECTLRLGKLIYLYDDNDISIEGNTDTASVQGEPLGEEAVSLGKERLGRPSREPFFIPEEALRHFRVARERRNGQQEEWQAGVEAYRHAYPSEAAPPGKGGGY